MKRLSMVILALGIAMGLSACEKAPQNSPDIADNFSASAEFIHNEKSSTGIISRENENWSLEMTAPAELNGIKCTVKDGKPATNLGDLTVEGGQSEQSFLLLISALEAADNKEGLSLSKSNGKLTASGRISGPSSEKGFDLLFSEQNQPEQLKILSASLTVNISGVSSKANVQANASIATTSKLEK